MASYTGTICSGHGECINEKCVCFPSWSYHSDAILYRDCTVPLALTNTLYILSIITHTVVFFIAWYKLIRIMRRWVRTHQQEEEEKIHVHVQEQQRQGQRDHEMQIANTNGPGGGMKKQQKDATATQTQTPKAIHFSVHSHNFESASNSAATAQMDRTPTTATADAAVTLTSTCMGVEQPSASNFTLMSNYANPVVTCTRPQHLLIPAVASSPSIPGTPASSSPTPNSTYPSSSYGHGHVAIPINMHKHKGVRHWISHLATPLSLTAVQQLIILIIGYPFFLVSSIRLLDGGPHHFWGLPQRTQYIMYNVPITATVLGGAICNLTYVTFLIRSWATLNATVSLLYASTSEARATITRRQEELRLVSKAVPLLLICVCILLLISSEAFPADNTSAHRIVGLLSFASISFFTLILIMMHYRFCTHLIHVLRNSLLDLPDEIVSSAERRQRATLIARLTRAIYAGLISGIQMTITSAAIVMTSAYQPLIHHGNAFFLLATGVATLPTLRAISSGSIVTDTSISSTDTTAAAAPSHPRPRPDQSSMRPTVRGNVSHAANPYEIVDG